MADKNRFKGVEGLQAFKVMCNLLRSLWYIQDITQGLSYEAFIKSIEKSDAETKRKFFNTAVAEGVFLSKEEILHILYFATDNNGIRITKENIDGIPFDELQEKIVNICMELSEIKLFF